MLPPRMPSKMSNTKIGSYGLVSNFKGYRAREDVTTLPSNIMIAPSKNVLLGTNGRISHVRGYTLDGPASAIVDSGILSSFDFVTSTSAIRNLRVGFLTAAANDGKLQYRYVTGTSTVNWVNLQTNLTNVRLSFTGYWDNPNGLRVCLWVDGSNNVYSWNGAVTTLASATINTVTKQGSTTWAQSGFLQTGTRSIVINGVSATYTGGENTTTLTGVSVDFSNTVTYPVGSIIHQAVVTVALSSMTGIVATFGPSLIGCGRNNQVYLGTSNSNNIYISKVNDYTNYSFTSPVRVVGEGALIPVDNYPIKFIPQEVQSSDNAYDMWISQGKNNWGIIRATLSTDLTKEKLEYIRLKTTPLKGSFSEKMAIKMKNHIAFVGNDATCNTIGFVSYQDVPDMQDISYPIVEDMTEYDFTDGSMFYYKNYLLMAVPRAGVVRIYNMTDQTQQNYSSRDPIEQFNDQQPWFWEAPITYPVTGFYVTEDGDVYGHSFTSSESYKLFTGGSFNGQQIEAQAYFAYDDKGDRTATKASSELWVEGYIKQNTKLSAVVTGDLDAFATSQTQIVDGNDNGIVAYGTGGGALGKNNLGTGPLGISSTSSGLTPSYFHVSLTFGPSSFYLEQISFYTKGIDLDWQLITFGTNAQPTNEGNNDINR